MPNEELRADAGTDRGMAEAWIDVLRLEDGLWRRVVRLHLGGVPVLA